MIKILITGVNGMLGRRIAKTFIVLENYEVYGIGRSATKLTGLKAYYKGDICELDFLKFISSQQAYDYIIHCAAIVNLKLCEEQAALAWKTHVIASEQLAELNPDAIFFYISTDSVFDGKVGQYTETSIANSLNQYANTKYEGEKVVAKNHPSNYILRLNIYGFKQPLGTSLFEWGYTSLKKNQSISGYNNVIFNPLYVGQVANILLHFMEKKPSYGLYHLGAQTSLSKYAFLVKIADFFGFDVDLIKASKVDFSKSQVNRPLNTTLAITKLKELVKPEDISLDAGLNLLKLELLTDRLVQ